MLNSLKLINEKEVKIKIKNFTLKGFSCINLDTCLEELFLLTLSKLKYRRELLNFEDTEFIKNFTKKIEPKFNKKPHLNNGIVFELWVYYMVMEYFKNKDVKILRNVDVRYNGNNITEIDLFVEYNNNYFIFECKNKFVGSNTIFKLFGIMKILDICNGVIATTKKFKWNLEKEDILKECNIYILDELLEKDKNRIFKELKDIFK